MATYGRFSFRPRENVMDTAKQRGAQKRISDALFDYQQDMGRWAKEYQDFSSKKGLMDIGTNLGLSALTALIPGGTSVPGKAISGLVKSQISPSISDYISRKVGVKAPKDVKFDKSKFTGEYMSGAFDNLSKVIEESEKEISDIKTGQADSGNQLNMLMSLMPILKADIGEEGNIMEYLKSLMGGNLDLSNSNVLGNIADFNILGSIADLLNFPDYGIIPKTPQ